MLDSALRSVAELHDATQSRVLDAGCWMPNSEDRSPKAVVAISTFRLPCSGFTLPPSAYVLRPSVFYLPASTFVLLPSTFALFRL
jgi:hypothetical protein